MEEPLPKGDSRAAPRPDVPTGEVAAREEPATTETRESMNVSDDRTDAQREPRYPHLTAKLRSIGLLRPYESHDEIRSYDAPGRGSRIVSAILCALPLLATVAGLAIAFLPVAALKAWVDGLSPDGDAERFTLERLAEIQGRVALISLGWMCLGLVAFYLRYRFPGPLRNGLHEISRFPGWLSRRLRGMPAIDRAHAVGVVVMTLAAATAAALMLDQPARGDEAGTYTRYVAQNPLYIVAVYEKTNNHVLHSLLAWLSVNVFGDGLLQLRLPTFFAGLLLLPTAYVAVRRHHGRESALLALAFLASSTLIVDQSSAARGYQMLHLAFVVLIAVLPSLVRGQQWAWLVFVITVALGFWIVPMMVYPAVIVGVWLCIARFRDAPRNPRTFFVRLAVAVVSVIVIVAALYAPAQAVTQAAAVASEQSTWGRHQSFLDVLAEIPWRVNELVTLWRHGRPEPLEWLLVAGLAACPLVAHRTSPYGARLLWSSLVGIFALLAATMVYPPFWSLTFLYVLWMLLAAVGIIGALSFVPMAKPVRPWVCFGVALVVYGASVGATFDRPTMEHPPWFVGYKDAEPLVDEIGDELLAGAGLDASLVNGSSVNYYLWVHDPRLYFRLQPMHIEGRPETVFLAIPPDRPKEAAEERRRILVELMGYEELPGRTRAGDTFILRYRRVR